jgi:hypothetical protein
MITVLRLFRRAALLSVVVTVLFFDSFAARAIPFYPPQTSLIVALESDAGLVPMGAARTWHAIFTGFVGSPVTRSRSVPAC